MSGGLRGFLAAHADVPGCWEWPGWRDKDGYGRAKVDGKTTIAHRAAYALARGPIPQGMSVLHRCDNPPCCNPAHLFLGTQADNCADAVAKDRHARGERNGISKLTDEQAAAIRRDDRRQESIAAEFGISQSLVSAIKTGERWGHVR